MYISRDSLRTFISTAVVYLNTPAVKETAKKVIGVAATTFGLIEAYDLYMFFRGKREISDERTSASPRWMQVGHKIAMFTLKLSIVLNGLAARPSVYVIGKVASLAISDERLTALFGPATTFAANPWHPKHIVSIAATLCGIPSNIQSIYRTSCWIQTKVNGTEFPKPKIIPTGGWMSDSKARMIAHINLILGRPFLHTANFILKRIYT